MKNTSRKIFSILIITVFALLALVGFQSDFGFEKTTFAQTQPTPTPEASFNQKEALAKLNEQIKGKENEPAEKVFKNIQMLKGVPAGRILRIMEMGYSRSLGVNCTHCHTPEKWESEDKNTKQIAREMMAMVGKINGELLKGVKNINEKAMINCATCHRGQIMPALNVPVPAK